jgi:hypothetical protein
MAGNEVFAAKIKISRQKCTARHPKIMANLNLIHARYDHCHRPRIFSKIHDFFEFASPQSSHKE